MLRHAAPTLAILAILAACAGSAPAATSTGSSVVGADVIVSTSIGTGGCLPGVAATDFGSVPAATSRVTTADCQVTWSTNADSAMLRVFQSDGTGTALKAGALSVPDYVNGTTDWDQGSGHFGACLRAVGATTTAAWADSASCTTTDGTDWNPIPATAADLRARVAGSTSDGEVFLRFGLRTGTSTAASYSAGVTFEVVAPDPGPGSAPVAGTASITGSAAIGQTLTAGASGWNMGNPAGPYAYQWVRCGTGGGTCVDIAGQTGSTYVVTGADGGRTLRVRVSVTNVYGTATATSTQSAVVLDTVGDEGGTNATTVANASQLSVTRPPNAFEGDVLVAQVVVRDGTDVAFTSVPAGWTLIRRTDNSNRVAMASYYKILTAAEPAGYTWQWNVSDRATIGVHAFSAVDHATPVTVTSGATAGAALATATGVTVPDANSMLIALNGTRDTVTFTDNNAMNVLWQLAGGGGNVGAFGRWQVVAAGASGTRTAGLSLSTDSVSQLIALRPRP